MANSASQASLQTFPAQAWKGWDGSPPGGQIPLSHRPKEGTGWKKDQPGTPGKRPGATDYAGFEEKSDLGPGKGSLPQGNPSQKGSFGNLGCLLKLCRH